MLEEHGIRCMTKNQYLIGGSGELPPNECWPELWVMEDRDAGLAEKMVQQSLQAGDKNTSGWTCECGEILEGQFTECWNCGTQCRDSARSQGD